MSVEGTKSIYTVQVGGFNLFAYSSSNTQKNVRVGGFDLFGYSSSSRSSSETIADVEKNESLFRTCVDGRGLGLLLVFIEIHDRSVTKASFLGKIPVYKNRHLRTNEP